MVTYLTRDERVRTYVAPVRIVWQTEGAAAPKGAEVLLAPSEGQSTIFPKPACLLKHTGEAPGLLLDFGRELHGGVLVVVGDTPEHKPVRARIRFGESVTEAMSKPNQDHAIHDHITHLPWCGVHEIGNTGFRFVRLDLLDEGDYVELQAVQAVSLMRPVEYAGAFKSSDERLNEIWATGARTVHLCMQTGVWDGIKRDRLVWLGDMHPETSVISRVFGDQEVVRWSLDYVRDETPLPNWMNGLSSYSIWWVIIQRDWYLHTGNLPYLQAQGDYLEGLLELLASKVDSEGREQLDGWRFLDWPTSENEPAIHAGLQALLKSALDAGVELCRILGKEATAQLCETAIERLKRYVPDPGKEKSPAALLALSGLADAREIADEVLLQAPLRGISTFYGYYVLQALAKAHEFKTALEIIRKYWGAMLDLGATSFWEDFNLDWVENTARIDELTPPGKRDLHKDFGNYCYKSLRHSLCHGWASGPTAWLMDYVLGVKPVAPGGRQLVIEPHLEDLEWVEGAYWTAQGVVKVKHTRSASGEIRTECEVPAGVEIVRP